VERPIQLLILEDDATQAAQIDKSLRSAGIPFESDRVETSEEFEGRLLQCIPDVIILDHGRPEFGHTEALKLAKEKCPEVPCISLLGPEGAQAVIQEFKRGATDCVLKADLNVLGEAVQHAVDETEKLNRDDSSYKLLRETEYKIRLFVQATRDYAIYMLDPKGHIISWNEGAERIEGYSAETIIGQYFGILFAPEERAKGMPEQELARASTEGISHSEGWVLRPDGVKFWSEWGLTAVRDRGGRLQGFLKVAHDVTARREAEERLQRLTSDLEQRVRDRTAQLEASNRDLEAFTYSISHDLQAPLRHVRTFGQQLQKESGAILPPASREYLEIILRSTETMTDMVTALLKFSRVGRGQLSPQVTDLKRLIQEVRRELELELDGRKVDWAIHPLPSVFGDPFLLRQVFYNLLSNALKYTGKRPSARIELGSEQQNGQSIIFVRDNGVGFDMEYAHKLFGVFQRLHSSSEFPGTGIGLAIIRRIVEKHGGRVWAEGKPGEGATFFVSLPRHQINGDPQAGS
jgi:PAS domain S-box-containing protein